MPSTQLPILNLGKYLLQPFNKISPTLKLKVIVRILLIFTFEIFDSNAFAQQDKDLYRVSVDLLHIKNEQINISVSPPKNNLDKGIFALPKVIPGYYGAMDFGQYVSELQAFDTGGSLKPVRRIDVNSWLIEDLKNVVKLKYKVSPGWKSLTERNGGAKSAGSRFLKDSVFVINYNSLVGHFKEFSRAAYEVEIIKNKGFYASSALSYHKRNDSTDFVRAKNYRHLVDAPVLYCIPDTTFIHLGKTEILVSFYSKTSKTYSSILAAKLKDILENQRAYLGGKLPVSKYAFLIYHESFPGSGLIGDGLEHSQSTICLYGSHSLEKLPKALEAVASHEFFHILTPLNIHSEEIEHFDFLNPKLSKHLWLYEGMTEYATIHMPVKQGMISLEDFCIIIEGKIKNMRTFDNSLPLTQMSTNAIQRQDQYMNFYQKGALVNLCLDIYLRQLSNGKSGTQVLMEKLAKKYGPRAAFEDDKLFDVITSMTFSQVRSFFHQYVEGSQELPLKAFLSFAGIDFDAKSGRVTPIKSPTTKQILMRKSWIGQ